MVGWRVGVGSVWGGWGWGGHVQMCVCEHCECMGLLCVCDNSHACNDQWCGDDWVVHTYTYVCAYVTGAIYPKAMRCIAQGVLLK